MIWTTNAPKVPGWYWYRRTWKNPRARPFGPMCLEVTESLHVVLCCNPEAMEDFSGQWAGPLEPPT